MINFNQAGMLVDSFDVQNVFGVSRYLPLTYMQMVLLELNISIQSSTFPQSFLSTEQIQIIIQIKHSNIGKIFSDTTSLDRNFSIFRNKIRFISTHLSGK